MAPNQNASKAAEKLAKKAAKRDAKKAAKAIKKQQKADKKARKAEEAADRKARKADKRDASDDHIATGDEEAAATATAKEVSPSESNTKPTGTRDETEAVVTEPELESRQVLLTSYQSTIRDCSELTDADSDLVCYAKQAHDIHSKINNPRFYKPERNYDYVKLGDDIKVTSTPSGTKFIVAAGSDAAIDQRGLGTTIPDYMSYQSAVQYIKKTNKADWTYVVRMTNDDGSLLYRDGRVTRAFVNKECLNNLDEINYDAVMQECVDENTVGLSGSKLEAYNPSGDGFCGLAQALIDDFGDSMADTLSAKYNDLFEACSL